MSIRNAKGMLTFLSIEIRFLRASVVRTRPLPRPKSYHRAPNPRPICTSCYISTNTWLTLSSLH